MHRPTEQLKRSLANTHSLTPPPTEPLHERHPLSAQKYMQHFETINKTLPQQHNASEDTHEDKFTRTLLDYTSKSSPIDAIMAVNEDALHLASNPLSLAPAPTVPALKPTSLDTVRTILDIFSGKEQKENQDTQNSTLLVLQYYSEALKDLGRRDKIKQNRAKVKTIIKDPTYHQLDIKEIQTDPKDYQPLSRQYSMQTKRKDLILMELIREKKRKNFAPDYFTIMEMKLMELLEFILEDQIYYIGMDPASKVREVLKNLQTFQGKTVEGESKINMLRIFFQEFTNLKHEKDQLQTMHMHTPMKKVENKEKQATTSTKHKDTIKDNTPQRKPTKNKKDSHITWIENEQLNRRPAKFSKLQKQEKQEKQDEWIGQLE